MKTDTQLHTVSKRKSSNSVHFYLQLDEGQWATDWKTFKSNRFVHREQFQNNPLSIVSLRSAKMQFPICGLLPILQQYVSWMCVCVCM